MSHDRTASSASASAAAAQSSSGALTYLQCPLCLDEFSASVPRLQPRLLPSCAHSFCTRCLHQQWALQAAAQSSPTFLCPIDGLPVRVTAVEAIPVNRVLLGLLSMMASTAVSERDFRMGEHARPRCQVDDHCPDQAEWHCFSDDADMCANHKAATHDAPQTVNLTKNHRLCRIEEKAAKQGPPMCERHHSAMLLWCVECRVHACHACATLPVHAHHPESLKLLGHHLSNANLNGLVSNAAEGYFCDQQQHLLGNIVDEEKRMKVAMEKEARELVQTMQVIDSNELHTQQSLDTEFDNLIASLEQRRAELHTELRKQSATARHQLDSRMLQLSLNHSLTNTVLEESSRVSVMNPFTMVTYMDSLLLRHEKSLEKYWEYAYESSLVSWFPLRLAKEVLAREISSLGQLGVPLAPSFHLDECKAEAYGLEVVWHPPPSPASAIGKDDKIGLLMPPNTPLGRPSVFSPGLASPTATVTLSASQSAVAATTPSFYILQMSPLDPFDLSQGHIQFQEVYRGPHTNYALCGLQPSSSYLFRVQAVSLMGEGIFSQQICISTLAKGQTTPHLAAPKPQQPIQQQSFAPTLQTPSSSPSPRIISAGGFIQTPSFAAFSPRDQQQPQQQHQQHQQPIAQANHGPAQSSAPPSATTSRRASLHHLSLAGPAPLLATRALPAHAHPPSGCASWADLWKLSVILREKDLPTLMRFFQPQTPASFQLLYRASRDGFATSAYHLHVDGQGPTLTVIRVKKDGRDYVFGGYTPESWTAGTGPTSTTPTAGGHWLASNQTWLFSLINAYKRALKFRIKRGQEKFAQYCDAAHAAMFGVGGDLSLLDPLDSAHHHFGIDQYELDQECDARSGLPPFALPQHAHGVFSPTMLSGGEVFVCKEVECYTVNAE